MLVISMVFLHYPTCSYSQIKGTVIDNILNVPISNVVVIFNSNETTITNDQGVFTVPELKLDTIVLMHPNYISARINVKDHKSLFIYLQPNEYQLSEIMVTGISTNKKIKQIPGSYGVLRQSELSAGNQAVINESLNLIPGIYNQSGSYTTSRLIIRGIGSRTPYSTNRVRVYLDDIPITTGDGISTIEDIDPLDVSRIEVLKGPSSAIYGSGLGGVVKIFTNYPSTDKFLTKSDVSAGSFSYFKYGFQANTKFKKTQTSISYHDTHSNGYRQNNYYNRSTMFINHTFTGNKFRLNLSVNHSFINAGIPSSLDQTTYKNHPEYAASNWLAIKGFERNNKWLAGINTAIQFSESIENKTILFAISNNGYERRPFNNLDDELFSYGIRNISSWKSELLSVSAGLEMFMENYNWMTTEPEPPEQNIISNFKEQRNYSNYFIWLNSNISSKLILSSAVNLHYLKYKIKNKDELAQINNPDKYTYDPVLSPRIGLNYQINDNLNIYTSGGHGFSAPSVEETLLPEGEFNSSIKPEQGWNIDLGVRGDLVENKLFFDLTLYKIMVKNLLVTKRINEDEFYGINAGRTNHSGIEIYSKYQLAKNIQNQIAITGTFFYSVNKFKDFTDDGLDYSGKNLPGIPDLTGICIIDYKQRCGCYGLFKFIYTGQQYLNDQNEGINSEWQRFDLDLGWEKTLFKNFFIDIRTRIENVFDVKYAPMIVVNAQGFGTSDPRYYYPGLPRNMITSVKLSFRF